MKRLADFHLVLLRWGGRADKGFLQYFTGASIFPNRKFAQEIKLMVRDKSDNITKLIFNNNYDGRVGIFPLDKKIHFSLPS